MQIAQCVQFKNSSVKKGTCKGSIHKNDNSRRTYLTLPPKIHSFNGIFSYNKIYVKELLLVFNKTIIQQAKNDHVRIIQTEEIQAGAEDRNAAGTITHIFVTGLLNSPNLPRTTADRTRPPASGNVLTTRAIGH